MPSVPPSQEDQTYTLRPGSTPDALLLWRFDRLRELGVGTAHASVLCHTPDSPHTVARLLRAGCPVQLAVRILT